MSNTRHHEAGLHWKWVAFSVVAGLLIVGASYYVIAPVFPSIQIRALVMLVGFIVTGIVIGYFSPGITIKEAGLGGLLVSLIILTVVSLARPQTATNPSAETLNQASTQAEGSVVGMVEVKTDFTATENLVMLALGVVFSLVGGWVGEKLQGDADKEYEKHAKHFLWKWVIVAVVIGFALNVLFVFLLAPFFKFNLTLELFAFLISFIVAGFIVGVKSPGSTIKEPAVAGLFIAVLDWIFLEVMISMHVAVPDVVKGLAIGFLFTLLGAWLGERVQGQGNPADA